MDQIQQDLAEHRKRSRRILDQIGAVGTPVEPIYSSATRLWDCWNEPSFWTSEAEPLRFGNAETQRWIWTTGQKLEDCPEGMQVLQTSIEKPTLEIQEPLWEQLPDRCNLVRNSDLSGPFKFTLGDKIEMITDKGQEISRKVIPGSTRWKEFQNKLAQKMFGGRKIALQPSSVLNLKGHAEITLTPSNPTAVATLCLTLIGSINEVELDVYDSEVICVFAGVPNKWEVEFYDDWVGICFDVFTTDPIPKQLPTPYHQILVQNPGRQLAFVVPDELKQTLIEGLNELSREKPELKQVTLMVEQARHQLDVETLDFDRDLMEMTCSGPDSVFQSSLNLKSEDRICILESDSKLVLVDPFRCYKELVRDQVDNYPGEKHQILIENNETGVKGYSFGTSQICRRVLEVWVVVFQN